VTTAGKRPPAQEEKSLIDAIEKTMKSSLDVSKRLGELSKQAAELETKRATLAAECETAFAREPGARRDEVMRELEAASGVLAEAGERGNKQAGRAAKFVLDLAQAVETSTGAERKSAPGQPAGRPAAIAPKGSPRGAHSAAPQTKPSSPSTPKPHSGDDFEH
jgi:hypothetical protein